MVRCCVKSAWLGALCVALVALNPGDARSASSTAVVTEYRNRPLEPLRRVFSEAGLNDCPSVWKFDEGRFLAACRTDAEQSRLRLYLVQSLGSGGFSVAFRSAHFGDAYYVNVVVLESMPGDKTALLLAESGAEFSYGVRVYAFDGGTLEFAGEIDEVIDRDGGASSVLPALRVRRVGGRTEFSFSELVMRPASSGGYSEVPPGQVRYVIDSSGWHRNFPSRGRGRPR